MRGPKEVNFMRAAVEPVVEEIDGHKDKQPVLVKSIHPSSHLPANRHH